MTNKWILKLSSPSEPARVRYLGKRTLPVSDALEAMTFDSEEHAVQAVSDLSGSGFSHLLEPMKVPANSGLAFLMAVQASAQK
jgi:hypothetical protein